MDDKFSQIKNIFIEEIRKGHNKTDICQNIVNKFIDSDFCKEEFKKDPNIITKKLIQFSVDNLIIVSGTFNKRVNESLSSLYILTLMSGRLVKDEYRIQYP